MVKVVWGEPPGSPERGRPVYAECVLSDRPAYAPPPVGRPPIYERHPLAWLGIVAACLVLPVLVGAVVGWLLP